MNPYILIGISIILTTTSQILFKEGVNSHGPLSFSFNQLFSLFWAILSNKMILAGMFTLGLSFIVWIVALSRLNLSIAYPLTSINFILIGIFSATILQESVSLYQVLGTILISIGIVVLFQH